MTLAVAARSRTSVSSQRTRTPASDERLRRQRTIDGRGQLGHAPARRRQKGVGGGAHHERGQDAVGLRQPAQGGERSPARGDAETSRIARAPCSRALMILCVRCE